MSFAPIRKDPDAVLNLGIDWTKHLDTADTISTSTWLAVTGLVVTDKSFSGAVTKVQVAGGTVGQTYKVTNRITTGAGETLDLSLTIIIEEL